METILIATDFSSAARNATVYGFELAKSMRAKVILFTAYQASMPLPDGSMYISPEELERNSYERLYQEAEAIDPRRTVALETHCNSGPVNSSILAAANTHKVSYIIVGMKDRGREIRKYFGSTVTDLCKGSSVPLIVVPADAAFSIPKAIALASDITNETDIHILEPLKKIAEKFRSNLYIVRVIKKEMDEVVERRMRSERVNLFLTSLDTTFEFAKGKNVAKVLNSFVDEHAVNMLAVVPHEHTLFERIFTRSVTKDLVFKSHTPLLILPGTSGLNSINYDKQTVSSKYIFYAD